MISGTIFRCRMAVFQKYLQRISDFSQANFSFRKAQWNGTVGTKPEFLYGRRLRTFDVRDQNEGLSLGAKGKCFFL